MSDLLYDADSAVDPLADADKQEGKKTKFNRAKVGSARPSSLLYTYGPGAIIDLPQFTIMPTGFDDWDRVWARTDGNPPEIRAPRLREIVAKILRSRDVQLRPHPRQPKKFNLSSEGNNLGVPARVFPQWLRCTGCDHLGKLPEFSYDNTHPYRTDLARFEHRCTGRKGSRTRAPMKHAAVPARYLLACVDGHLDEFPYDIWVHRGQPCAQSDQPPLRMVDRTAGKGASAIIECAVCEVRRPMNEAQGEGGQDKLPRCRGRLPHLDAFAEGGCKNETRLMLVGASNLWFPSTQSIIVMPESEAEQADVLVTKIRATLGDALDEYHHDLKTLRVLLQVGKVEVGDLSDEQLRSIVDTARKPAESVEEQRKWLESWDPVDLLVPEWRYLQVEPLNARHEDEISGLTLSARERSPQLRPEVTRVLAVEKLRKVNALVGFTRIDDMDRAGDLPARLAPLARAKYPKWTVATEDRGEGIFLQLDEGAVATWERRVHTSSLWRAHVDAHERNFSRRFSETAAQVSHLDRFKPPRYWLVHTFAHVLIRQLAMTCGYSAASLSERLYAWEESDNRSAAAGLLICTTASDSDGTLGGLVQLSDPARLQGVVSTALLRATRCSSDPICAMRQPENPEDFLHGAACHCCVMASETSCERANRFLDRRLLVDLPGSSLGFFGHID
ncbi:DrmB family protein [Cryptosporangium sp. NPDC051539]|uniref:DrmB family protein n=1 Tax=Cryptosporangium sp. NPDC051539 TaxID=3363962 RepID=UPI00378FD88B